ncbi:hypothetical protein FHQ26_12595 [Testudinibacter sp. TR-2022]|uniref:hypothetical protein n=1 Tax=Testudinibacter sp. TR-2022 TaxID=2585029 RepID=UPI001118B02F|nr:hypothetical protein [Testudinibacter sp. TR-2022]TNH03844.1 hypothetical protein FHQ26_12595 [Testudinibacter sp. TR-2022]
MGRFRSYEQEQPELTLNEMKLLYSIMKKNKTKKFNILFILTDEYQLHENGIPKNKITPFILTAFIFLFMLFLLYNLEKIIFSFLLLISFISLYYSSVVTRYPISNIVKDHKNVNSHGDNTKITTFIHNYIIDNNITYIINDIAYLPHDFNDLLVEKIQKEEFTQLQESVRLKTREKLYQERNKNKKNIEKMINF